MLMQALTECCRGFDSHDGRLSNNPNQMNVLAIYSDIDLNANGFESGASVALSRSWFGYIRSYLYYTGAGDFRGVAAKVVLNRGLLINESEIINSLKNSEGGYFISTNSHRASIRMSTISEGELALA